MIELAEFQFVIQFKRDQKPRRESNSGDSKLPPKLQKNLRFRWGAFFRAGQKIRIA